MRKRNPVGTAIIGGIAAKKLLIAGAAIWGLYALSKKKSGAGSPATLVPAPIKAGQAVTVDSYRVIQDRRAGMDYVQATGQPGAQIGFTSLRDGIFTRNTVFEGGVIYAEVK